MEADLTGFRIQRVRGGDFPAITPNSGSDEPGGLICGHLHFGLGPETLARLDAYEDRFYDRSEVILSTADGPERADVYVLPESYAEEILSSDPWSLGWFMKHAEQRYWDSHFGDA